MVELLTILETLNIHEWPDSDRSSMEHAWCSASLYHPRYLRLNAYSVFWTQSSDDTSRRIELWIGRTLHKPAEESNLLVDSSLVWTISQVYNIRITEVREYYSLFSSVWRNKWYLVFRVVAPITLASVIVTISILQLGFTIYALSLGLTLLVTNIYAFVIARRWGQAGNLFGYFVPLFFISPYVVGLSEDSLAGRTMATSVNTVGLFFALLLGILLALIRAVREDETWDDLKRTNFRSTIRLLVIICITTTTGFGIHVGHTFALQQVLVEGNRFFVLLIVCGIVAYYAFLVNLLSQNND